MSILLVIAISLIILGTYCIFKGKIPFLKEHNEVKNIAVHSQIEGGAVTAVGILFLVHYFIPINNVLLIVMILGIGFLAIVLEILLKAI